MLRKVSGEFCTLSTYVYVLLEVLNKVAVAMFYLKEMVHALAVRLSSYGCTWSKVGRAPREAIEKHTVSPRATRMVLSCSPNFLRASITR